MSKPVLKAMGKTVIAGLGATGFACLKYLANQRSAELVVIDSRARPPLAERALAEFPAADFRFGDRAMDAQLWAEAALLVVSPGIAPDDALLAGSESITRCSDIDLFMAAAQAPVVGVTGTNGKSTVTALLGHMLGRLGLAVRIGGNLGEPALSLLNDEVEVYVLELSSFQLEYSGVLSLAVGAVLNLSPDHLDRHGTLDAYAAIKREIFRGADALVFNTDDRNTQPDRNASAARNANDSGNPLSPPAVANPLMIGFGTGGGADFRVSPEGGLFHCETQLARVEELGLRGRHNHLNLLAAMAMVDALARVVVLPGLEPIEKAASRYVASALDFTGLPHRSELVAEIDGVSYINDSKATNVGACIASLEGLLLPTKSASALLVAGGQAKGATFSELVDVVSRRVSKALLFGEDADLLESALGDCTAVERCDDLDGAVQRAHACALSGDTVLLAPACASFDMFENYAARGDAFRAAVASL